MLEESCAGLTPLMITQWSNYIYYVQVDILVRTGVHCTYMLTYHNVEDDGSDTLQCG